MKSKGKHTMNNLRKSLVTMSEKEKQDLLQELHAALMIERGKEKSHAMGMSGPKSGPHICWMLRKCIAMVKTSMHVKGFHYNPRGGV